MEAMLVIDVDEEDIGREVNYISVKGGGMSYIVGAKDSQVLIRPLPKKKTVEVEDISDVVNFSSYEMQQQIIIETRLATDKLIALGWNDCLKEITGETE